jgi:hypothetical protein
VLLGVEEGAEVEALDIGAVGEAAGEDAAGDGGDELARGAGGVGLARGDLGLDVEAHAGRVARAGGGARVGAARAGAVVVDVEGDEVEDVVEAGHGVDFGRAPSAVASLPERDGDGGDGGVVGLRGGVADDAVVEDRIDGVLDAGECDVLDMDGRGPPSLRRDLRGSPGRAPWKSRS